MFDCKCMRCGQGFQSADKEDTFGDGKCPSCLEASRKIANEVDAIITKNRSNQPAIPPLDFSVRAGIGQSGFMGIRDERIVNQ